MNLAENTGSRQNSGRYSGKNIRLVTEDLCTGCGLCTASCPVQAISMKENLKNGFLYPHLAVEQCVFCGKCEELCPANHTVLKESRQEYSDVYAANNRDKKVRYKSASGGLYSAFALGMLRNGGSVAGVAYAGRNSCRHVMVEREEELEQLQGTKYFQSDMTGIYEKILSQVKVKNRDVLFCGTPCQVHAVKNYAQEKGIRDRIILIDLLCRGIPSPYVYAKYIDLLEEEYGKKVSGIQLKEKTEGWDKIGTMATFEDGTSEYIAKDESAFIKSFIETDLAVRESCFHCKYKTIHREGDITIADFWGLKNNHLLDNKGTSLVILSTEKGRKLFEQIKQDLDYIPSTMWRAYKGNYAAFHPVFRDPVQRKRFFELMHEGKNLREAVNEVL